MRRIAIAATLAIAMAVSVSVVPTAAGALDTSFIPREEEAKPVLLVIDEDSIDNGSQPNFFSGTDVNDHIAKLALRKELAFFNAHEGGALTLYTGQIGDEGWFALKTIPPEWDAAGPTPDGLRNYVGNPSQPYPHNVGPGLGTGPNPEKLLDKVPDVTPLRATGLGMLEGKTVCAVVYDSDVSINYGPLNGSLKGANLGTVAFEVGSVTARTGSSSGSLPKVELTILDSEEVCERELDLFEDAPGDAKTSAKFDDIEKSVTATSDKYLSYVVLKFCDGTGQTFQAAAYTKVQEFKGTGSHAGKSITGVWIKSGDTNRYHENTNATACVVPTTPPPPPPVGEGPPEQVCLPNDAGELVCMILGDVPILN